MLKGSKSIPLKMRRRLIILQCFLKDGLKKQNLNLGGNMRDYANILQLVIVIYSYEKLGYESNLWKNFCIYKVKKKVYNSFK